MGAESFIEMGGYAGIIWPSYGLAAIFVIGIAIHSVRRKRSIERHHAKHSDK